MLSALISLPLWQVLIGAVLAALGAKAYVFDPLARRVLTRREQDLKARLNTSLTRALPKTLQTPRRVLMERLLHDPELQAAIDTAAIDSSPAEAQAEARIYVDELMPSFFALFYFRIGYWLARRYLRSIYDVRIAKQPPTGAYSDIPDTTSIVLVGNHRSNLDVAVLSYLSSRTGMVSFAAGEWAAIWPINRIMHMSGSYIIRRDRQSVLYKRVLARYMHMMIDAHMTQGIFLEGGLSRDGAVQPVKLGLLRYILAGLGSGNTEDIVFIPVSFNYDKVPEDLTLLAHQDQGFSKKSKLYTLKSTSSQSLGVLARLLRLRRQRYGQAAVSFGPALSAADWLAARGQSVNRLDDGQRKAMVAPIADTIISEIKAAIPVLPVSLVATVFDRSDHDTLTDFEVTLGFEHLLEHVQSKDIPTTIDMSHGVQACEQGLDVLLSRGVLFHRGAKYQVNPEKRSLLAYYALSVAHHFAEDT